MTWEPMNLGALPERPPVTPSIGGLIYPGSRCVWSGVPESAKTWAALAVALEEIRAGNTVMHVDFEMFAYETRDRLKAMGATDDEVAAVLHVEPDVEATELTIAELADAWKPSLVFIDAAAGAFALQGLDDNKRADVEYFSRTLIDPFRARGIATVVLDHVTKNSETRGRFSIGSERKVGGADVHLGFEPVVPFGRGRTGLFKVVTHKDRFGHLTRPNAAELELRSDPDTFAVTWQFRPATSAAGDDGFRPTALMEKVSRYLERQSEPVSRTNVEENVTGKATYVRRAIDVLVSEKYVLERPGARRALMLELVRPFDATPSPVPTPSHSVPLAGVSTPSPVPPLQGDGDGDGVDETDVARWQSLLADDVERGAA